MSLTHQDKTEEVYVEDSKTHGNEKGSDSHDPKNLFPANRRMTAVEKQEALRLAEMADPGIETFSYRGFILALYVLCVCCCSGDNGMDPTVMSAINSMTQFQSYFGIASSAGVPKTGIVFGIYTIGNVCSVFPNAYLPDRIGRRWSMFVGNLVLILGAMLTANATSMSMFMAGRFLTGFGCTFAATSAKSYLAEITSPSSRGRFMGLLNSFYYVGQIVASGIAVPTGRYNNDYSWRAPLFVQGIPAILNVAFVMFLPESPRWLYSRGHTDRAARILADLHSKERDVNSPLIQLELREIEEVISLNDATKHWWDFRPLFFTAASRYRIYLCIMVSVWGQLSGNGLITYYLTVLLNQAGITSPDRQRVLNFVNSITSFVGALSGTAIADHVGRRFLMLFGSWCCAAGMSIVAGLLSNTGPQSVMRANAGVSFIFLFMVFFSFGWTPIQALYPTEVLSFEMRAKGLAFQTLITQGVSCINTFALPSALAALSWKTYIIFACWDVVGIVTVWFLAVETKQLTLEEMDAVFESDHPRKFADQMSKEARKRVKEDRAARNA
ncbi:general substrate transporter [Dacryopinax primogenitus]|uniref:General substrate transporter n=1 Tax=Dacryopinax primogenitus (strain DJM 731) TaxID=1858805 RepID=M5GBX4_DACPD|nr:general substrate transporter [Dacryopinax primogenitus]EJU06504.1 general substrate transporter [Dacryopinax primogenitus]